MVPPLPLKPPPPLSPMAVFSISTPINQCYCLCHHGNWTCCISLRSGGVFHNSQTDGSRGCSRSTSPPSAKSAPRETQNPPLSASPSTHDRLTAAPPTTPSPQPSLWTERLHNCNYCLGIFTQSYCVHYRKKIPAPW